MQILTLIVSVATLIATIYIPIIIADNTDYNSLFQEYISFEYAKSFQSIIDFFYDECKCDVNLIAAKYKEHYKKGRLDNLHLQRRYLNEFFVEMALMAERRPGIRRKIKRDYTGAEANIVKIIMYMNKAVDDDENDERLLYKPISSIKNEPWIHKKGVSGHLKFLYDILKKEGRWMK